MSAVFVGLIFISLNIPVHGVDILPDLVGYLLIAGGSVRLSGKSSKFQAAVFPAVALAVCGVISQFGKLPEIISDGRGFTIFIWVMGLGDIIVRYLLAAGAMDMEKKQNIQLEAGRLIRIWKYQAAMLAIMLLLILLPLSSMEMQRQLRLPLIVSGIASLVFLVCFYQTRKKYLNICKNLI